MDGKEALDKLAKVENFVFHDFRRYLSTTMAKLHVPIDVTETILNHATGSRTPIQRVYDRHDRLPEMREALQIYENLAAVVAGKLRSIFTTMSDDRCVEQFCFPARLHVLTHPSSRIGAQ